MQYTTIQQLNVDLNLSLCIPSHWLCTEHNHALVMSFIHFHPLQITASAGQTLLNLDLSNCLSLTDQCCTSIARNCKVLEVLGLTNLKEIKGDNLCKFFQNEERARQFRAIMLSGSKNVKCTCHTHTYTCWSADLETRALPNCNIYLYHACTECVIATVTEWQCFILLWNKLQSNVANCFKETV